MAGKVYNDFDEFYAAVWEELVKHYITEEEHEEMRSFMEKEKERWKKEHFDRGRNTQADVSGTAYGFSLMF